MITNGIIMFIFTRDKSFLIIWLYCKFGLGFSARITLECGGTIRFPNVMQKKLIFV